MDISKVNFANCDEYLGSIDLTIKNIHKKDAKFKKPEF